MLKFTELHLHNWRNFGHANIIIDERLFIVGANASGKSNLLDVFRFLKDVTNNGLQKAVTSRGGIKKLRYLNARGRTYIEVFVKLINDDINHPEEWTYKLQFNSAAGRTENRDINISLESITKNGEVLLNRTYNDIKEDYLSKQFTHLEQPAINGNYRELYDCFRNITYVNIIPQLIRESESFLPSAAGEDFYGRSLLETIAATPERTRTSRLKSISKVLKLAVPQLSDLVFMKESSGRPHLQVRYTHFRPQGAFQWEDQFSDGTLRLIGIIWAIMEGEGLLLLEEPELYLHSEIVKQLPMFIANAQNAKYCKKRQVVISSHSYDLLNTNTINLDEIVVLDMDGEGTSVKLASEIESIKTKSNAGYTPADAVLPKVTPKGIIDGQLSYLELI